MDPYTNNIGSVWIHTQSAFEDAANVDAADDVAEVVTTADGDAKATLCSATNAANPMPAS